MEAGATKGRVPFVGQAYYNAWYPSRALRKRGWKAEVLNSDAHPDNPSVYHGHAFPSTYGPRTDHRRHRGFYLRALLSYDIFHFSNAHGMRLGSRLHEDVKAHLPPYSEIRLLKRLGKRVVYS